MGDRGNIKIEGGAKFPTPVWLYTHWGGSELKQTLAAALDKGRDRWGDPSYLARVIFCQMVNGDDRNDGVTGFGLSAVAGDNEYLFVVVNMERKTVYQQADHREGFNIPLKSPKDAQEISFEDFVKKSKE